MFVKKILSIFILLSFFLFTNCPENKITEKNDKDRNEDKIGENNIVLKGDRLLGIELGTAENEEFITAYTRAKEAKIDFNHISMRWIDVETAKDNYVDPNGYLNIINIFYPLYNTKVLFTILSPTNTTNGPDETIPPYLTGKHFDDPEVIDRFKKLLDFILLRLSSTDLLGLVIGNEIDIYLSSHLDEIEAFKTFFISVSEYARTLRPGLKVGFTATLYGTIGDLKNSMVDINQYTDFVCLTYYPLYPDFTVKNPDVVKNDFKNVFDLYSKPIYFQECGYPTSIDCNSNEDLQAQFAEEVFKSWDMYRSRIKVICFYQFTDWPQSSVDIYLAELGLSSNAKLSGYIRTLGFRTYPDKSIDKKSFNIIKLLTEERNW